ncbi:unnamed protein product [Rhizophagus irregularis]|uniref:Uncharacterized protein n=1 Tax=Rhizophagus irregularis TaxID=588596 RepID=A0A915Z752_9GLOM|nr:unnamed protein product [Rhizophagus irregularis]CAB5365380.1 unnamed protein product [Rhizophagus irregularis]
MHRLMSWFIMTLQLYLPIAISLSSLHVSFENYTNYTSSPLHIIKGDTQLIPDDPRPIIENQLKKILQPPKKSVVLYIICAEFGTEKALSIKKVSKEIGHGIIHVNFPYDVEDFGITFGEAFNFEFEEDITLKKKLIQKIGGTDGKLMIPVWK